MDGTVQTRLIEVCPIDGSTEWRPTGWVMPEGELRRCPSCGLVVSQCSPERYATSMQEFDSSTGTAPTAKAERRRFELAARRLALLSRLSGRAPADLPLVDIGASVGTFVAAARQLGYPAEGVEPAPKAAAAAQAAGLPVRVGLLEEVGFADGQFAAATLFEVIKHLADPLSLLREVHRVLRPGGLLMIGTGNADSWTAARLGAAWEYFEIDSHGGHIAFHSPRSLAAAAAATGFEIAHLDTRRLLLTADRDKRRPATRLLRLAGELLAQPTRWAGRGHDLLAVLRRA